MQLVEEHLKKHHPKKIAFDLSGMDTMRDFGVMESQILYFMGVRPIWDRNNLAIDVELIPQKELKRPRIDVFMAMGGMYKENFGTRVKLLDKAVRLVSALKEKNNNVRLGTLETETRLLKTGMSKEKSRGSFRGADFRYKAGQYVGHKYFVSDSSFWSLG